MIGLRYKNYLMPSFRLSKKRIKFLYSNIVFIFEYYEPLFPQ
jgi:hypothetical protein